MDVKAQDGNLVVTITLSPPRPSATGKTLVVASTGGFVATTAAIDGKPVRVNLTAIIGR